LINQTETLIGLKFLKKLIKDHNVSIDRTDDAEKGRPRSLKCPRFANSVATSRNDSCPPFGFLRRSRLASATMSGLS